MDESAVSGAAAPSFTLPQSVHDDDSAAIQAAKATVEACQIGALFEESKFLMLESLQELIKVHHCSTISLYFCPIQGSLQLLLSSIFRLFSTDCLMVAGVLTPANLLF